LNYTGLWFETDVQMGEVRCAKSAPTPRTERQCYVIINPLHEKNFALRSRFAAK